LKKLPIFFKYSAHYFSSLSPSDCNVIWCKNAVRASLFNMSRDPFQVPQP
jgi:hypothetical protein